MPREIIVDWTAADGGGGLSVLYFPLDGDIELQRQVLGNFLLEISDKMASATTWSVRQEGRELADATGTLTGVWSEPTIRSGAGSGGGFSVANTTQLLVRFNTNSIVNGRFVRGRMNIPGIAQQHIDGDWTAGILSDVGAAATILAGAIGRPGVWHRPKNGAGGSFHAMTSASVWNEASVLRKRRS